MTELSPAAQAVLDAAFDPWISTDTPASIAAAALQAVADQWKTEIQEQPTSEFIAGIRNSIDALNEIAAELEGK